MRPTSDRVREAVFNMLFSLDAVEDAAVLDLFAGSGALGIEALSRGAASVVFVENDPAAVACIEKNLATTGLADRATIVRVDAERWLDRTDTRFDLALVDPPYDYDRWDDLLGRLPAEVAVLESDRPVSVDGGSETPWQLVRRKEYGATVVSVVSRVVPGPTPPEGEQ